jgi:hypothetical protein
MTWVNLINVIDESEVNVEHSEKSLHLLFLGNLSQKRSSLL